MLALPVFHHFGVHAAIGVSLYNGVKTVLLEKWNVGHYFQCIQKYKVSVLVFFWLLLVLYLYIKDQHIHPYYGAFGQKKIIKFTIAQSIYTVK